jgi:hypothetical protein
MEMEDYKELLGQIVKIKDQNKRIVDGLVVGIDENVGITVVEDGNPKNEIICLNKKDEDVYDSYGLSYEDAFDFLTISLGMGEDDDKVFREVFPPPTNHTISSCPFD